MYWCQQSVEAIRVSVAIQAFFPAQSSVVVDSFVARNPLLLLHSSVGSKCKTNPRKNHFWKISSGQMSNKRSLIQNRVS